MTDDAKEGSVHTLGPSTPSTGTSDRAQLHPLLPLETWWRDRSSFLESKGYRLRPRFRPGWIPSWLGPDKDPFLCEDAFIHMIRRVIDARREGDGTLVAIKQVSQYSKEAQIALIFSTPESLEDPCNHCVPVLDHFQDAADEDDAYIVMPLLRQFNDPEFYVVSEVVDFLRQTLQGLVHMHQRKVAHCDLSHPNIMMDGNALYPRGFHPDPAWQHMLPDFSAPAEHKLRSEVKGVKYYIIDFDYSAYYGDSDEPPLAYGDDGLDRELPELSWGRPYDPFPGDVFTLGNVYRKFLVEKYTNLNFLEPLVTAMTQQDPAKRPTAEEALARFEAVASKLAVVSAHWRLRPVRETQLRCLVLDVYWGMREIFRNFFGGIPVIVPITLAMLVTLHGPRRTMDRIRTLFIRL